MVFSTFFAIRTDNSRKHNFNLALGSEEIPLFLTRVWCDQF